jgi:response regulator RpfG family c-di-GMP phosphodiesterase
LQLFASNPVNLVLLDYHVPGMNGDVVAAHMKACQRVARVTSYGG